MKKKYIRKARDKDQERFNMVKKDKGDSQFDKDLKNKLLSHGVFLTYNFHNALKSLPKNR